METFTLSRKELHRPGLLKAALGGRITNRQVATALRVTIRHVRRLKRRFEAGGATALGHRSRGRPAPRRVRAAVRAEVSRLMTTLYVGFNDTHLTEKLREVHGLTLARESVRRRRCGLGRPAQRARRPPRARRRRTPEAARGALVQIDGSPFAWLEARGPELMLLGAVDDATTEILALHFRPAEDVHGYTTLFQRLFTRHGLPLALYGDRLAVWRRPPHDLALILSGRYRRVVARDNTVRLGPRWLQLPARRALARRPVEVRELLDGTLVVVLDGAGLATQPPPGRDFILKPRLGPNRAHRPTARARSPRRPWPRLPRLTPPTHTGRRPLASHPWRPEIDRDIRQHLTTKSRRTFSRSSKGGHSH